MNDEQRAAIRAMSDSESIRARLQDFERAKHKYDQAATHRSDYTNIQRRVRLLELDKNEAHLKRHAPADLRALLDQHDADQARIAELEQTIVGLTAICEDRGDALDRYESVLFYLGIESATLPPSSTPQEIVMIIRHTLKGEHDETNN